jgi:Anti-sigma-K factor rskA/Putative zinc-finger
MKLTGRTGGMKLTGRTDPHTLAGAYAMDALDDVDRARFERHLTGCDSCAAEVTELGETAARLGGATAVTPPPAMKARVLAAAARTSQHVPAAPPRTRRRALFVVPAAAAAAALIAVAAVFGVASSDANQRLDQAQQRSQAMAAVLAAHDATMMTGRVAGGGHATVVMSHDMDALVFSAAGLPSGGYELWLIGPDGDRAAGPVDVSAHGMAGPMIAGGLRPGDHLRLVAEPAGGTVLDLRL